MGKAVKTGRDSKWGNLGSANRGTQSGTSPMTHSSASASASSPITAPSRQELQVVHACLQHPIAQSRLAAGVERNIDRATHCHCRPHNDCRFKRPASRVRYWHLTPHHVNPFASSQRPEIPRSVAQHLLPSESEFISPQSAQRQVQVRYNTAPCHYITAHLGRYLTLLIAVRRSLLVSTGWAEASK